MKRVCAIFILILSTICFAKKAPVVDNSPNYRSYLVGDSKGKVFYQENSSTMYPLASVTKVMTILVTLDAIRNGEIGMDDEVTIDWEILTVRGSIIPMTNGEKITVRDLLKSAAIKSANNAAYALAKYVGKGSIENFVKKMNAKAKSLGLENELEFHTPAGLPDYMTKKPMDMGSAKGIYGMTLEALNYPEYLEIAKQKTAEIKDGTYKIKSTIKLLGKDGIYGLKTGYHRKAKFNITVLSNEDDANIVTVVMGGKTQKIRDQKVLELNKRFHSVYKGKEIVNKNIPILRIPVKNGYVKDAKIYGTEDYTEIVPKNSDITIVTERLKEIEAPMKEGESVGTYQVIINGKVVHEDKLVIKSDIDEKGAMDKVKEIF